MQITATTPIIATMNSASTEHSLATECIVIEFLSFPIEYWGIFLVLHFVCVFYCLFCHFKVCKTIKKTLFALGAIFINFYFWDPDRPLGSLLIKGQKPGVKAGGRGPLSKPGAGD